MGNCLIRSSKALAATEEHEPHREVEEEEMTKRMTTFTASELKRKTNFDGGKSKQAVRFRVRRESRIVDVEPKGEALRIRVVVTQEELKQILNYKKNLKSSSVEQLVTAMKLRGRTNDQVINCNWRPALESIPEDH